MTATQLGQTPLWLVAVIIGGRLPDLRLDMIDAGDDVVFAAGTICLGCLINWPLLPWMLPIPEGAMKGALVAVVALAALFLAPGFAAAAELRAEMRQATPIGPGDALGTVTISDGPGGAVVTTVLRGLPPGPHGFHVHENGSCQPTTANGQPVPAGGAGGHLDPQHTGKHEGPEGNGHLGDLPALQVAGDGSATQTLTAPHIKDLTTLRGKSVIIHAGGDNYSDQPQPLGGGGGRIACGVIE
jgi:Cu-Zn family superoxide dismutase